MIYTRTIKELIEESVEAYIEKLKAREKGFGVRKRELNQILAVESSLYLNHTVKK